MSRYHNHGQFRALEAKLLQDLDAAEPGHDDVQQDGLDVLVGNDIQGLLPVFRTDDIVPLA